jgi:DNA polymerase I-like protein with 3'-5' exonuclease and polymerase domains
MSYKHTKLKSTYGEKLKHLAEREHRTMTNMLEVLIDQAFANAGRGSSHLGPNFDRGSIDTEHGPHEGELGPT